MAQRSEYWSCSKFADWLRGTPKGKAKTSEGWDEWRNQAQAAHPVRYWIAEEVLDRIQNFLWWPVDKVYDVKYYINNRWVTRTHALTASPRDIPRGEWRDVGNRFLPCLFNELQEFVETELAWWHIAWDNEAKEKFKAPFWARGWFRWRVWRCPEAGLENLEWQMALKHDDGTPTQQAQNAREIYELYTWWTQIYHERPDPYDVSGWSAICDEASQANGGKMSIFGNLPPHLQGAKKQAFDSVDKIERDYEQEDEQMMIRLIKIRNSLWT